MPVPSKADGNVPFIGPRSRYSIIGNEARWVFHRMDAAISPGGEAPVTAAVANPTALDPVVSPGRADYGFTDDRCVKGGLFTHLGRIGRSMIIDAAALPGNPTVTVVDSGGNLLRTLVTGGTALSGFPIRLAAGEYLKVSGGTAAGDFGFLVRLQREEIL